MKEGAGVKLRPEQARFQQGRSITEQIFMLRNTIKQVYNGKPLDCQFHRKLLIRISVQNQISASFWDILRSYGIPEKLMRIIGRRQTGSRLKICEARLC